LDLVGFATSNIDICKRVSGVHALMIPDTRTAISIKIHGLTLITTIEFKLDLLIDASHLAENLIARSGYKFYAVFNAFFYHSVVFHEYIYIYIYIYI
jgi:hypothetical protein